MSDEGEKTCPLCAEEMDLTDQQLRPCKCGYDICVWCWNHIMDMAEKDDTEGRCPACRNPYNKEKIVGTASTCERLVAEISVEKKQKSQKGKTKASEGRKQLSSVRVIQRNLVYIVGLPLSLGDEDLLQRKEYFGQYGKVLKVSISRTAAGAIQHFANNTCSVYITYSKEDEAVRSIQAVHGFILEGRPLRACFGTTKYCHAWLRSMPCTNPDCLYLHEYGSQEDSFTKDEIISEYTRGRVQQVTGATNEMQRRSGNTLPPAADDYSNNITSSWAKPISKNTTNDPANSMKGSPPNTSSVKSLALPAAASWGTCASNSQPVAATVATPNGSSKQKADTCSTQFSPSVVTPSSHADEILNKHGEESPTTDGKSKLEQKDSVKQVVVINHKEMVSEIPLSVSPNDINECISIPSCHSSDEEERIDQLSSDISSMSISRNHGLQPCEENFLEPLASNEEVAVNDIEADLLSFNNQRLSDPEVVTRTHTGYVQNMPQSSHLNNSMGYSHSSQQHYGSVNGSLDPPFRNTFNLPVVNGHSSNLDGDNYVSNGNHKTAFDLRENSIISDILSMDFDPWAESLTSPQSLAKLLGESDKQQGSQRVPSSRKTQNCNQSRFSFARNDDGCIDQGSNFTPNLSDFGNGFVSRNFNGDIVSTAANGFSSFNFEESDRTAGNYSSPSSNKISVSRSQVSAPPGFWGLSRAPPPGFASNERMEQQTYDNLSGNHMFENSSLLRKVHQTPAPVYNGGVSELEFMDPAILAVGGRVPGGVTSPGLDMRSSNFPSHLTTYENNNRLQHLMQRSFTQQNQRFSELGGDNLSFPHRTTELFGVSSRIAEPNNRSTYQHQHQGNLTNFQQPRMSNGHWDGWNEIRSGNDIAMAELLRNERLGFNKYYSGYEDTKFRVPSSGDVYNNRTFGI